MSEHVWETFDGLFKTVYRQGRQVAALEERIADLERRLQQQQTTRPEAVRETRDDFAADFPTERAA